MSCNLRVLMIGPPPVADRVQNRRIAALDAQFAAVCAETGAPYVTVFAPLRDAPVWMDEVAAGDGAHPAAAGYDLLTDLVEPAWQEWLLAD